MLGGDPSPGQCSYYAAVMSSRPSQPPRLTPGAGLCDTCEHQVEVRNTRGSVFSLCARSRTDPAYPRYPRLPVLACPGYEAKQH
jgi:hypothetical protein